MAEISASRTILVVEDNPEDFEATQRAFRKAKLANPIDHCEDGDEALTYLFGRMDDTGSWSEKLPGLILLDLNLPGTDGREVLERIKAHDKLKKIPVIVLTTSDDEQDIDNCYEWGANSYVHKPVDINGFMTAIQRIKDYWFEIVLLPGQHF
ncbi:response regulator [Desulfoplanes sp.]